jgi:tRNA(adenine34) deaminase
MTAHGRRNLLLRLAAVPAFASIPARAAPADPAAATFAARALALRDEAIRRGDQPYGAVVVLDGRIVGEGVSAVITRGDPDAHAERLALRDALARTGRPSLDGALLFGSSRACGLCEAAARRAGVARMFHGIDAIDDGPPRAS